MNKPSLLLSLTITSMLGVSGLAFAYNPHVHEMTNEEATAHSHEMTTQQMIASLRQKIAAQQTDDNAPVTSHRHPMMMQSSKNFYAGMGLGISEFPFNIEDAVQKIKRNSYSISEYHYKGFGQQFFAGYNINPFTAIEVGYMHYAPANYNVRETKQSSNDINNSMTVKAQGLRTMIELHSPVVNSMSFFTKAGALYTLATKTNHILSVEKLSEQQKKDLIEELPEMTEQQKEQAIAAMTAITGIESIDQNARISQGNYWTFIFGVGLNYAFNEHVSAQIEMLHAAKIDAPEFNIPAANLYTAGLRYTF